MRFQPSLTAATHSFHASGLDLQTSSDHSDIPRSRHSIHVPQNSSANRLHILDPSGTLVLPSNETAIKTAAEVS